MIDTAVRDTLRDCAGIGPYFAVEAEDTELDQPPWRGFDDLLAPETVADRIDAVLASLSERAARTPGDVERRAAASTCLFGLAVRLISPAIASAALGGTVIACLPDDLRWRQADHGPVPIGYRSATAHGVADASAAARTLHQVVIDPLVRPLVAAFTDVSPIVLWSNVASAFAGAANVVMLSGSTIVLDPVEVVSSVLRIGPLAGAGSYGGLDRRFRRTSCCLIYRVPGFGTCGDCVLDHRPTTT